MRLSWLPWIALCAVAACAQGLGSAGDDAGDASSSEAAVPDASIMDAPIIDAGFADAAPPDGPDATPGCHPHDCALAACDGESCGTGCECAGGVAKEVDCADGADDDADGLKDCADPDCDAVACSDGDVCTSTDVCSGTRCVGAPVICDHPAS